MGRDSLMECIPGTKGSGHHGGWTGGRRSMPGALPVSLTPTLAWFKEAWSPVVRVIELANGGVRQRRGVGNTSGVLTQSLFYL